MFGKSKVDFCIECRREVEYWIRKETCKHVIREKEYEFEITVARCKECGEKISLPGLMDLNAAEIDEQYRKIEGIIAVKEINNLMALYRLGKAPLSLALGFGEITITRYLEGQVPSKAYSDIMKKALTSPEYMKELLDENRAKIGETAYRKAMTAAVELSQLFSISDKMRNVISYIFEQVHEITPLALQKILYFSQGIYMTSHNDFLFEEDCQAWVHGPVYESVYNLFKDFKYNPIEDNRFALLADCHSELTEEEKNVLDLVVSTFGMYSGKVLEMITHNEKPWKEAREGYAEISRSNEVISKEAIKEYFLEVKNEYGLDSMGVRRYIDRILKMN